MDMAAAGVTTPQINKIITELDKGYESDVASFVAQPDAQPEDQGHHQAGRSGDWNAGKTKIRGCWRQGRDGSAGRAALGSGYLDIIAQMTPKEQKYKEAIRSLLGTARPLSRKVEPGLPVTMLGWDRALQQGDA